MNHLEKYKGFNAELALAETFSDLKLVESKAAAAAEFAKRNGIAYDEQNEWGRFRLVIEAKKGEWLDKYFPSKVNLKHKSAYTNMEDAEKMPVSPKESASARRINKNPELVQTAVKEIIERGRIITPSLVSTVVQKLEKKETVQDKKKNIKVISNINERLIIEKKLKEIAHEINMTYTKEQRIFFITLIKQ